MIQRMIQMILDALTLERHKTNLTHFRKMIGQIHKYIVNIASPFPVHSIKASLLRPLKSNRIQCSAESHERIPVHLSM